MAALLAIVFALPFSGYKIVRLYLNIISHILTINWHFSSRILFYNENGPFDSFIQAVFHAHLGIKKFHFFNS